MILVIAQGLLCHWGETFAQPKSLTKANHPRVQLQHAQSILSAAFSPDKIHLVAVSASEWLLFESSCWTQGSNLLFRSSLDPQVTLSTSLESDCLANLPGRHHRDAYPLENRLREDMKDGSLTAASESHENQLFHSSSGSPRSAVGLQRHLAGVSFLENWQPAGLSHAGSGCGLFLWDSKGSGDVVWVLSSEECQKLGSVDFGLAACLAVYQEHDHLVAHLLPRCSHHPHVEVKRFRLPATVNTASTTGLSQLHAVQGNSMDPLQEVASLRIKFVRDSGDDAVTAFMAALPGSCNPYSIIRVRYTECVFLSKTTSVLHPSHHPAFNCCFF